MKDMRKVISILAALLIVATMFFSALFISSNINHDCTGENCPICEQMQVADNVLTKLSLAIISTVIVLYLCVQAQDVVADISNVITYLSPVRLKVKMLN